MTECRRLSQNCSHNTERGGGRPRDDGFLRHAFDEKLADVAKKLNLKRVNEKLIEHDSKMLATSFCLTLSAV